MAAAKRASSGRRAQEGKQHCSFCKNHDKEEKKIGHVCAHKDCSCLLCKLTVKGQVAMKYQQKVWRHQKREGMDKHCKMIGVSTRQLCDKCRNHYKFSKKQGHKTKCRFEKCVCPYCNLTDKRRLVMKLIQRVRRANVISRAISSDEDEDDVDTSSPHSDDMSSGSLDEQQENEGSLTKCAIVGAIEQVTQAIEALPIDLSLPSKKDTALLKPAKNSSVSTEVTLGTEHSPLRENPPPDGHVPFEFRMPINSVQPAVSINSYTKHVDRDITPLRSDIVAPPETCYVKKACQMSPTPDNKSDTFEAPVTIKKEKAEHEPAWAETTSFEQKYASHSHYFSSPSPHSSYVARPSYFSYPSNMASSYPLLLKQDESYTIFPSTVSSSSSSINGMCKSVFSPCCKWSQTDYMIPKTFDSNEVNNRDVMRDNSPHYESNVPSQGRMQYMLSVRDLAHHKNHYAGCYVPSALPYSAHREYVDDRPRVTKGIPESQFAEHHAMREKQRYSNYLSSIKRSSVPSLPKVSSKTSINATTALQNPILAGHLRLPRPTGAVPYQNISHADDSLQRSPIFLPYPSQNYQVN